MKGLLYKEWKLCKKNILCFFALALVFSVLGFLVFLSMKCGNLRSWAKEETTVNVYAQVFFYVPYALLLLAAEGCFKSICRDYEAGWMRYSYTLPLSNRKAVGVKYLMSILVLAGAFLYGLINGVVIGAMSGVRFSLGMIGNMAMILLAVAVLEIVCAMPLAMKVKTVKAATAVEGALFFAVFIGTEALSVYLLETYGEEILKNIINTYKDILGWLLPVSLLLVLGLGVVSFFISSKLYERRAR